MQIIYDPLHSVIFVTAKNSTLPLFETLNSKQDFVELLSIFLSLSIKNLSGTKVDPLYGALQISSSILMYA